MNTTVPGSNLTLSVTTDNITSSTLTNAPTVALPPSYSTDIHQPEFTIMVVLGLSLLLAGLAAFLAVCRPSGQEPDSDASCVPGESLTVRKSQSTEPQLKVWRRLGSYRRSYNLSFRRPPYRRPQERGSTQKTRPPARQTAEPQVSVEPQITVPCLFDYVTEI
ncbi:uncharacterized protein ACB058_010756 isoform 1-T4 [Synchiropus picturatus]